MLYKIVHELPATAKHPLRTRVRTICPMTTGMAQAIREELDGASGIDHLRVNHRTGSIQFSADSPESQKAFLDKISRHQPDLSSLSAKARKLERILTGDEPPGATIALARYFLLRPLLPMFWRMIVSTTSAIPFLVKGAASLMRGKLNVDVLDAAALFTSLLTRNYGTVGMLTMLLALGDALEHWTRERSMGSLTSSIALHVDNVWLLRDDDSEIMVPLDGVAEGDRIIVRAGTSIPVDGVVAGGTALVNQSSMTGEPLPVARKKGAAVFAGTVVEAGELIIRVTKKGEATRLHQIISFIEQSEAQKSRLEAHYLSLANRAVPFTFAIAGLVYLFTGSLMRASAVLLVDYSCALKLATPLAVLAAMRQGAKSGVAIRGGKYLERLKDADTAVFDKTGTLTSAVPAVAEIIPAPGFERKEVLKIMACLEEHFPHPVARAVVNQALKEGVGHEEEHTDVEYVVAHGIASQLHGHKMRFGSRHYIEHDEKVDLGVFADKIASESDNGHTLLFLAEDGKAAGMLVINDPVRPEAARILQQLREMGFRRILMLTGDDKRTAKAVAAKLSLSEYRAHVMPSDKARIISELEAEGCKVMMIGDGINDGPALSAASVGVAIGNGSDLARAVANVILTRPELDGLVTARKIARSSIKRIHFNVNAAILLNSVYLAGAMFSILGPTVAATLHNLTTLAISFNALRKYPAS